MGCVTWPCEMDRASAWGWSVARHNAQSQTQSVACNPEHGLWGRSLAGPGVCSQTRGMGSLYGWTQSATLVLALAPACGVCPCPTHLVHMPEIFITTALFHA